MANIHTVLDAIIENGTSGRRVQITVANKAEYETLRTRLVTLWSQHREVVQAISDVADPLCDLSLCGDWSATSSTATFFLGKSRRKTAKSYDFSITSTPSTTDERVSAPEPANDESIITPKLAE